MPTLPCQHRKAYNEEYKQKAVEFYRTQKVSLADAATNFSVTAGMLSKWVQKYSSPESLPGADAGNDTGEIKKLREELRAMRQDIGTLKQIMSKTLLARTLD
jgi:transposase-like protein